MKSYLVLQIAKFAVSELLRENQEEEGGGGGGGLARNAFDPPRLALISPEVLDRAEAGIANPVDK